MKFLGRKRNSHFNVLAKQFLSIALSYALIFVSVTSVSLTTGRAQTVEQPDTPKLKTSTGEAILRTTEPPIKNLPTHEDMKRKAVETDEVVKQHKVKTEKEKLPKAVRCRPDDAVCQEYWRKQGQPSSNISLLTPAETPINSLANLLALNQNPFANLLSASDAPQGFGTLTGMSSYRPPTTAYRSPVPAASMMQSGVIFGGWATEMTQRRNDNGRRQSFFRQLFLACARA